VGDEGVFRLITFVNSTTRTFRKATFPSSRRMIRINKNAHHLNRLLFCFFWGGLGAGLAIGSGDFSFLSTFSGAHGDRGRRIDTRSTSLLLIRSSKVRTSKKILVNLSRIVCRREELRLRMDSTSSGISRVFFSVGGVPARVNEAVLSGNIGGESGENLDCSMKELSGGEIERCSLNLEGFCRGEDVEAIPLEGEIVGDEGWGLRVKTERGGEEGEELASARTTMVLALSARSPDHLIIVFLKRKRVAYQFSHTLKNHPPPFPCIHRKMAPVNMLSDDSDSDEDINQITVNEHYAKAYAYRKERQELERREYQY